MKNRIKYRGQAKALVEQMTVEEAASQLLHTAPAIDRLGIPAYNWWNEALHGVGRAGTASVFPQAIAMAATYDPDFLWEEAEAIADEVRAKYNAAQAEGDSDIYKGLTVWSPNINIFRDPRWGRGHETYGEDPYLTKRMGNAFVKGLQGDGEYLKTAACVKHFAAHSGPEKLRHQFDAKVTPKDLEETYLPAFESAVKDAEVEAVMGAYNCVNGEPSCGSRHLLQEKLRGQWGFEGHFVSDCWAVRDFHEGHHYTSRPAESASLAVKMGCDLNCGCTYEHLLEGLEEGLVTEAEIREAAVRVMTTRYALGMFAEDCCYDQIPYTVVCQDKHRQLSLLASEKSIVLLKNDGILPLNKGKINAIAVVGPNAYSQAALYGNYHGDSDEYITNLEGIRRAAGDDIRIFYSKGCHLSVNNDDPLCKPGRFMSEVTAVVNASDVVILCVGLDETLEGEEGDQGNVHASGDKENLLLPLSQRRLVEKVLSFGKPVILVSNSGSAIDFSAYEDGCAAILQCWYSGQCGGEALGGILFGKKNPSGKLPVTFYYNGQPMPEFADYRMAGRTYKFVEAAPWRPFGFGLSYNEYRYENAQLKRVENADSPQLEIHVDVINDGSIEGEEIVQIYSRYEGETFEKPHHKLVAFERVHLFPGERKRISCIILLQELSSVLEDGSKRLLDGEYTLFIGGCQPDERSVELTGQIPLALKSMVNMGKWEIRKACTSIPYSYTDGNVYREEEKDVSRFSIDTPFCELYANTESRLLLEQLLPAFFRAENPYAEQMKKLNVSIRELACYSGGMLSKELLDKVDLELKKIE